MTKAEVIALANAVCSEHEDDVEFARHAVETMILEIPQIRLEEKERVWFDKIVDTYDTMDHVTCAFNLGRLTGLASKMNLLDDA